jgi:hypothetical protein
MIGEDVRRVLTFLAIDIEARKNRQPLAQRLRQLFR